MFTTAAVPFTDPFDIVLNLRTLGTIVDGDVKESDLGAASLQIGGELHKNNISHGLDTV